MSKQMQLVTKIIDVTEHKNKICLDLKELFDEDFNGNNGFEYLSKDALEGGFHSDLAYYFDAAFRSAMHQTSTLTERYKSIITDLIIANYGDSYYSDYEFNVDILDENRLHVAIAYQY